MEAKMRVVEPFSVEDLEVLIADVGNLVNAADLDCGK